MTIPVDNLPIDSTPMDESSVYKAGLDKVTLSPKLDKSGGIFCAVQVVVNEGDFEGRTVRSNWVPLPMAVPEDATKRDKILAADRAVMFGRFCRSFGIRGNMPEVRLVDSESVTAWNEWIGKFYGNVGRVTIRNQEFPSGSGRMNAGINDFIF